MGRSYWVDERRTSSGPLASSPLVFSQVLLFLLSMLARTDLVLPCRTAPLISTLPLMPLQRSGRRAPLERDTGLSRQSVEQLFDALLLTGDQFVRMPETANTFFPILMVE
jgi:hypothetical protein